MLIQKKVKTGLDLLFTEHRELISGKKIGLLCHPASVNSSLIHILELFKDHKESQLVRLFGPEHGIWGTAQDMEGLESTQDPLTHLPTISLYGSDLESLQPKTTDMAGIDLFIIDLQDIGTRFYTFIYTMAFCLKACAQAGIKALVLDRPNPINGTKVEGPLLEKGFESFVGVYPIPIRHGLTIGELAQLFNNEYKFNCDLQVIKMSGWKRQMYFDDTGLPWVYPSPNMPSLDAALLYPGLCLIEATELSEGRGTTKPFELVGAPYINPWDLAKELNNLSLEGIIFRPCYFKPTFQKWAHQDCGGVALHITDRNKLNPIPVGTYLIHTIAKMYPKDFKWREKPYEFVKDIPAIDLLWGNTELRQLIETNQNLDALFKNETSAYKQFKKNRNTFLIY